MFSSIRHRFVTLMVLICGMLCLGGCTTPSPGRTTVAGPGMFYNLSPDETYVPRPGMFNYPGGN